MTIRARLGGLILGLCVLVAPPPATAGMSAVRPSASAAYALVVKGAAGRTSFTLGDVEALGLRKVTTRSPWEAGMLSFEGVLLSDFLRLAGLEDAPAIVARASDGYTQVIPRTDWISVPVLLATRQDGRALTRRTQGPVRLVYPITDRPDLDTPLHKPRWVWLIESIEAAGRQAP